MSSHFSANQYESAFSPQRLQNYQIPAKHKGQPATHIGKTLIISNDSGHLNKNVKRATESPWGSFVGTWQMKRKPIQLKTKTKLLTQLSGTKSGESFANADKSSVFIKQNASGIERHHSTEENVNPDVVQSNSGRESVCSDITRLNSHMSPYSIQQSKDVKSSVHSDTPCSTEVIPPAN